MDKKRKPSNVGTPKGEPKTCFKTGCDNHTALRANGYYRSYCPEHESDERKLRRYNLSWDELDTLLAIEECQSCGTEISGKSKCIDHDHYTNEIRGIICSSCNRALGFIGDDLNGARNLYEYLKKHYEG